MSDVAYATSVLLAGLFAWAGTAKLADRRRTTETFAALALPAPQVLGTAVPVAELTLAAGLVVAPAISAYAALAMLAGFTTFVARAVRSGIDVGCACFGSARTEPVSSVEVLRNALLAGATIVAGFAAGPVLPGLDAVILVSTAAALCAVVVALADVRRRTGRVFGPDLDAGPGTGTA